MRVSDETWRRSTVIYRALVAMQTILWAVISLAKVISREPRASKAGLVGIVLAIGALLGIAGGLLTYYGRAAKPRERATIILTWAWFQVGGLFALAGYAITGEAICLIGGLVTLAVMHTFSPNRFRDPQAPEP